MDGRWYDPRSAMKQPSEHMSLYFFIIYVSASDEFYSLFYLGLFCDATGKDNSSKAPYYLSQASSTDYATRMGKSDYMTAVAQVHRKIRGWL